MTATAEATKPGTASTASPMQDEPIKWITAQEAEKFEKMLYKTYVKLGKDGNPIPESSEFFYRITGMHPRVPGIVGTVPMASENQFLLTFEVQKFYRDRKRAVNTRESISGAVHEAEDFMPVDKWQMASNGNWKVVCEDGNFFKDVREFCKEFAPDSNQ